MRSRPAAVDAALAAVGVALLLVGSLSMGRAHFWLSTVASVTGLLLATAGIRLLAERQGWKPRRGDSSSAM